MNNKIAHYKAHHEGILKEIVQNTVIPALRIKEAIHYALFPPGKRLRPILVYLCGELLSVKLACLDIIAAAIELTHCYSLIHDDLPAMDDDDFRRGKLSCHRAFDEATAILAGDGMQALAMELLLKQLPQYLNPKQVITISLELISAIGPSGMVSGQSLDLSELSNPNIQEIDLMSIHTLKTGKLISACINTVLAASNPDQTTQLALQNYARHLGLVFQMQDDYLDRYGTMDKLGKQRNSDSANNKITFANLYTQKALLALIGQHYHLATDALLPFENRAIYLLELTHSLQERGMQGALQL